MSSGYLYSLNLLKIDGDDAASFLQGQLSNDVNLLGNVWQYSGYCNPKGRLIALLQLWRDESGCFYALLSSDLCEPTVKRLRMYIMRSKVNIEVLEASIIGFESHQDLTNFNPEIGQQVSSDSSMSVVSLNSEQTILSINKRYMLINHQTSSINEAEEPFDSKWSALNITDGLPQISAASSESFIPQMINLDLLDGVNFKKGCYTGQEIVARMHYLGNLKQRMFVCEVKGARLTLNTNDKIYADTMCSQAVGTVLNASADSNMILAVLKLANINAPLYIDNDGTVELVSSQPYEIDKPN